MTYTDTQLKQALAKMLPDKITYQYGDKTLPSPAWFGQDEKGHKWWETVRDTELLHLCWLVERSIDDGALWKGYCNRLWDVVCPTYNQMAGLNAAVALLLLNATWQQRTIALCKVKEITI